jgi:hypothetical protein
MVFAFDIDTSRRLLMTLAVSRGFTPRAIASVMLVRSPRAASLMTFQSLNVVSLAAAIWF